MTTTSGPVPFQLRYPGWRHFQMLSTISPRKCHIHALAALVTLTAGSFFLHVLTNGPPYRSDSHGYLESIKETYSYYRRHRQRVNPLDFTYPIPGTDICRDGAPFFLILVISLHSRRAERDAIRSTWGSISRGKHWPRGPAGSLPPDTPPNLITKVVFLFGKHSNNSYNRELLHESAQYNDVVQANFTENYRNLTLKVLMGLKWALKQCAEAEFILKVDDDTFVNVPMMVDYVISRDYWEKTIMGFINYKPFPFRYYTKWQVSWEEYPYFRYPSYVSGNIYLFLSLTAHDLMDAAEYLPYVSMEDVYITGILAEVVRMKYHPIPRKLYNQKERATVCELATNKRIASHSITAPLHYNVWRAMLDKTCSGAEKLL